MTLVTGEPSTSTEQSINLVDCNLCGKKFSRRGINIHLARSHGSSQEDKFTQSIEKDNQVPCPHCGKYYIKLKSHIFKAHPEVYRETLVTNYVSKSDTNNEMNMWNYQNKQ